MADRGIRVVATDLETGEASEVVILPGNYVLVAAEPCRLDREQHHPNGTVVLTLTGRSPRYGCTVEIEHTAGDGRG